MQTPYLLLVVVCGCPDNHLRVDDHDFSYKGHVKNHRIYIDAALSVVKHIDHISHSACLEIEELAQLMCSFVPTWLDCCISAH